MKKILLFLEILFQELADHLRISREIKELGVAGYFSKLDTQHEKNK